MPERSSADVYDYMVTAFADAVRDCFKSHGHATKTNEEEATDTHVLVGLEGRLFTVEGDYQIGESVSGYDATGCGQHIALGSLHTSATFASLMRPEARVLAALRAANSHNGGVCPPFKVLATVPHEL